MPQTTVLYRFYDHERELLYVGISKTAIIRWSQHGSKPWWREVVSTRVEHFFSRSEARAAELEAIRTERPRYNVADQPRPPRPPRRLGPRLGPPRPPRPPRPVIECVYWLPDDGSERCLSVRQKVHGATRSNAERTAQPSSWRCALPAGHDGPHRARTSARQAPWSDPEPGADDG